MALGIRRIDDLAGLLLVALMVVILVSVSESPKAEDDKTVIKGDVKIKQNVDNVSTITSGTGSVARSCFGTITANTVITGDIRITGDKASRSDCECVGSGCAPPKPSLLQVD